MPPNPDQILTVAQVRAAEHALIEAGTGVEGLMDTAGRGAAEWIWRIAARGPVTVLCGPGNNGGDGYVIAEALRQRGGTVAVVAAMEPQTAAARNARSLYCGEVVGMDAWPHGEVFVDCLFGSGLTRALGSEHLRALQELAKRHRHRVAVDLPSGVDSDTGAELNAGLPDYDVTVALGAWKFAHFLMPACARLGALRLVGIGIGAVAGAAQAITQPRLSAPAADAHKYRRGVLGIIAGEMPGASLLAAIAAQHAGAGYVKLLGSAPRHAMPMDLVIETRPLGQSLDDRRWSALLVGPGLGRDTSARERLLAALSANVPAVVDADALMLLTPTDRAPAVATPHEGEMEALERAFGLAAARSKPAPKPVRAQALAQASGAVIVAKGPDTVVAAPDGRLAVAQRASSWLSTAGTGDVLAGVISSRLTTGVEPFEAACQGVWLHAEAARRCAAPFTAGDLARAVAGAYGAAL